MNDTEIKLKMVAEEIKEVLRRHNLAASVSLHSPGHGEHFVYMNTDYSCAYMYEDTGVRFYSKLKDYKNREEQMEKQKNTSNMLEILEQITKRNLIILYQMSEKFDKLVNATHS